MEETHNKTNRASRLKRLFSCGFLLIFMFTFWGCQSVNKEDVNFDFQVQDLVYHEETNVTVITGKVSIRNDTIYNMESFDLKLSSYYKGAHIESNDYSYEQRIKHGKSEHIGIALRVNGEVDYVGYVSATPHFEPLWKTYLNVIIVLGVLILAAICYWIYKEFL